MDQLKVIIAKNLMTYRKQACLTQQELAEKINYSDKAVSKWERGEGTPDVFVLKALADMYGITVNDFLAENQNPKKQTKLRNAQKWLIALLSAGLVWLVATVVMVLFLWVDNSVPIAKYAYISAIPACFILLLVFSCVWGRLWQRCFCVSAIVWGTCLLVNVCFTITRSWLIYIVGGVLQLLVILWYLLVALGRKGKSSGGKYN